MDRYTAQQKNAEIAVQLRKRSAELELSFVTDSKYISMLAHQSA